MLLVKERSFCCWFVKIRLRCQSSKNQSNSLYTRKFIWNAAQNCINCEEIPLWYNMCWCTVWVCRNVIVWMSQEFWIEIHLIGSPKTLPQRSYQIFGVKVGIKINSIDLCINSERISGPVLMKCCKMHQTLRCLLKREKIMKTVKTIKSRIIHTETTPLPTNNSCSNNWKSTCQACNNGSPPLTHLTPRLHISNKCSLNHNLQNYNSNQPHKFTRLCIASVVQTTEKMQVYNNKKLTPTIRMLITQKPSIRYITHQVLYAMKSQIHVRCVMHCQKHTSQNLQNLTKPCLNTPVIIPIQIRRCRIGYLMILNNFLHGLFPQRTTQFIHTSCHY